MSQHSESTTIRYYNKHAREYVGSTVNLNMGDLYHPFLDGLPKGGSILDLGCGSGRDTKTFLELGYNVTAVDASSQMVTATTHLTGQPAQQMQFQEIDFHETFDGIWACASLLHVPMKELGDVVVRLLAALRPNGIFYSSFKEGSGERMNGDRLFVDFTEMGLGDLLKEQHCVANVRTWTTTDLRPGRKQRWVNALAKKSGRQNDNAPCSSS